jgi:hypothetical protein
MMHKIFKHIEQLFDTSNTLFVYIYDKKDKYEFNSLVNSMNKLLIYEIIFNRILKYYKKIEHFKIEDKAIIIYSKRNLFVFIAKHY